METVREWGKKIVLVLNKIDLLSTTTDLERVVQFIEANSVALLGQQPEIFPVSARLAKRAKAADNPGESAALQQASRFDALEKYIFSTLDEAGRIRLKLATPLGVAERLLDCLADQRKGRRRKRVLQTQEIVRRALAPEVGAGGQRLAELDRRRTDLLQRGRIVGLGRLTQAEARDPQQAANARRGHRVALDPLQRAMAGKRPAPAQQPGEVSDGGRQTLKPDQMQTSPPINVSTLARWKPASAIMARKASGLGKRRMLSTR